MVVPTPSETPAASPSPGPAHWVPVPDIPARRDFASVVQMRDGNVLIAGGHNGSEFVTYAEIYEMHTMQFRRTGSLNAPRQAATAAVLSDGRVVIVGGIGPGAQQVREVEVYEPQRAAFVTVGALMHGRLFPGVIVLATGEVVVAGGDGARGEHPTLELFDPIQGTSRVIGELPTEMSAGADAVVMTDGRILIVGGGKGLFFDPSSGALLDATADSGVSLDGVPSDFPWHSRPVVLENGTVFLSGGCCVSNGGASDSTAVFDPQTNSLHALPPMSVPRTGHTATLMLDGKILILGGAPGEGEGDFVPANSGEMYDPASHSVSPIVPMLSARVRHAAVLLQDGTVLVTGTSAQPGPLAELYIP